MNIKSFFYLLSTMTVLGCPIVMQGAATSVKGDGVITLVNNTTVPLNIRIGDIPAIRIESKKAFLLNRALFTKQDLTESYLTTQDLGLPASQALLLDDIDVNSFATGIIVKFTPSLTKKKTLEYTLEESEELKAERKETEQKKDKRELRERTRAIDAAGDPNVYMIAVTPKNKASNVASTIVITTGPLFDQKVESIVSPESPTLNGRSAASRKIWSHLGKEMQTYVNANTELFLGTATYSYRPLYKKLPLSVETITKDILSSRDQVALTSLYRAESIKWLQFKKTDGTPNTDIEYIVHAVAPPVGGVRSVQGFYQKVLTAAQKGAGASIAFPSMYVTTKDLIDLPIERALETTIDFLNYHQHESYYFDKIYFVFDNDESGKIVAQKYAQILYQIAQREPANVKIEYDKDGIGKKSSEAAERARSAAEQDELEAKLSKDLAAWLEENYGEDLAAWLEELARAKEDAKALSQEIIQHLKAVSTDCMALAQRLR